MGLGTAGNLPWQGDFAPGPEGTFGSADPRMRRVEGSGCPALPAQNPARFEHNLRSIAAEGARAPGRTTPATWPTEPPRDRPRHPRKHLEPLAPPYDRRVSLPTVRTAPSSTADASRSAGPVAIPRREETPLLDVATTRRVEARALAGLPPMTLMERAGAATARLALAVAPHARRIWIACGPGNNGGDGLVAAAALADGPREVVVTLDASPGRMPTDASRALALARERGVRFAAEPPPLDAQDLAVDALLGIGASRAPEEPLAGRIAALNASPAMRLAVDVPSGLDADSGCLFGSLAVNAHHTLTFLTCKPGLFTARGRDHAGAVWLDDLGVEASEPPQAWLGPCAAPPLPPRAHADHKGRFGDVLVVGGAPGMAGAALLAACAAHAAGAGRVYLAPLDPSLQAAALLVHPALMWRPLPDTGRPEHWHDRVVAIGCGGGQAVAAVLPAALRDAPAVVLDADAINAIASDAALRRQLAARARRGAATVLTPHPLEAARLAGSDTGAVQADRLGTAQAIADRFSTTVVLKGSGSVVAAPGERPWINATGSAALATAGTGDVLAGWIAGRWAAMGGLAVGPGSVGLLVREAVCLHGAAGQRWGASPARAADLVEAMAALAGGGRPRG